jgi:2-C-methyl-D-erythritol 4-phosphate cytidylyltransferase
VGILVAAGRGQRLGVGRAKAFVDLAGKPMLFYGLRALDRAGLDVLVLVPPRQARGTLVRWRRRLGSGRLLAVLPGGPRRQDSVAAGVAAAARLGATHVLIHDAARPFASPVLMRAVAQAALRHGAASAALPVTDTLVRSAAGRCGQPVAREGLWRIQTPQAFALRPLQRALQATGRKTFTDETTLMRRHGVRAELVPGEAGNFKITTAEDLRLARRLLRGKG